MAEAKSFNNVIIGQFVLTGVPIKVYVDGRYLTITDVDDVEDPTMGFGMDENGSMHHFNYLAVERLLVQGNEVTLDTYNKGMEDKFKGDEEPASGKEEKPEDKGGEEEKGIFGKKKEESIMKLKDMIKEISQEEVDAEVEGAEAAIDAAKAKLKAAQASMKNTIKTSKEKIKAAKSQPVDESHEGTYTFGTGDIVKNINKKCPHYGSMGIVKDLIDSDKGTIAIYTVTNNGNTFKAGDSLAKTIDQLTPIQAPDGVEEAQKINMNIQIPDIDPEDL